MFVKRVKFAVKWKYSQKNGIKGLGRYPTKVCVLAILASLGIPPLKRESARVCLFVIPLKKRIESIIRKFVARLTDTYIPSLKNNGASESHQNNCLKTNIAFAIFLGPKVTFYDINRRQQTIQFLDTKIKSADIDPDKRWITTWNDYLNDIECFLRWLFNEKMKELNGRTISYPGRIRKLLLFLESKQCEIVLFAPLLTMDFNTI